MAIDTAQKRSLALNASEEWGDLTLPIPDGEIDLLDRAHLLSGYYLFAEQQFFPRHELAMRRLWPFKELILDE